MNERLVAKVRAVNKANAKAMELYSVIAEKFSPFVGQKIVTSKNELMAKVRKVLPQLTCSVPIHAYWNVSDYSVYLRVKTCEFIPPNFCTYYEIAVYIGELKDQVLTKICEPVNFKTDFTTDEILKKREIYEGCKKLADEALSNLHPFGEYDS